MFSADHHPPVYIHSPAKHLMASSKSIWKPGLYLPGGFSEEMSELDFEDQDTVLHCWNSNWIPAGKERDAV